MNRWHIYTPEGVAENVVLSVEAPPLPPGYTASLTPPAPAAPPAEPVQLTPREFMSRLTLTRQQEITAAALTLVTQGNAGPMTWLFRLLGAVYVDPAEPETAGGVAALEAAGLITAEEAAALLA